MKRLISMIFVLAMFSFASSVYACDGEKSSAKASKASSNSACGLSKAEISTTVANTDNVEIKAANVINTGSNSCAAKTSKTSADYTCGSKSINAEVKTANVQKAGSSACCSKTAKASSGKFRGSGTTKASTVKPGMADAAIPENILTDIEIENP